MGRGLREKLLKDKWNSWDSEENEPFRALKDKGIRILEKGIRIAY